MFNLSNFNFEIYYVLCIHSMFSCIMYTVYTSSNIILFTLHVWPDTGCKAEAVGKPEATFFKSALEDLGCEPAEAVMIGDVS